MSAGEEMLVSETGGAKATNNVRMDMIPVNALQEIGRDYGYGAAKYGRDNWKKGYEWSLSYAALLRHLTAFWGGESRDPEGDFHHLAAVCFHAIALMEFEKYGLGTDDRWLAPATTPTSESSSETPSSSESQPFLPALGPGLWDLTFHPRTGNSSPPPLSTSTARSVAVDSSPESR